MWNGVAGDTDKVHARVSLFVALIWLLVEMDSTQYRTLMRS